MSAASAVSEQGIKQYMEDQVRALAPGNLWWKIFESVRNGVGLFIFIALVVLALVGEYVVPGWFQSGAAVLIVGVIVLYVVASFLEKSPGAWRRYSIVQCFYRHPWATAKGWSTTHSIRKDDPDAEFEVAVLEQDGKALGAIFFQMLDDFHLPPKYFAEGGKPLLVLGANRREVQLGYKSAMAI